MKLTERLGKEWIFFDGGMGTILQEHDRVFVIGQPHEPVNCRKRGICPIRMRLLR